PWAANRREYCLRRMKFHAIQEQAFNRKTAQHERAVQDARRPNRPPPPSAVRAISEYRPLASYHRDQKVRWERGMSRPWGLSSTRPSLPAQRRSHRGFDPGLGKAAWSVPVMADGA